MRKALPAKTLSTLALAALLAAVAASPAGAGWLAEGRHTFKVRATVGEILGPVSTTKLRVGAAG